MQEQGRRKGEEWWSRCWIKVMGVVGGEKSREIVGGEKSRNTMWHRGEMGGGGTKNRTEATGRRKLGFRVSSNILKARI